ncbi:MAG: ABC transporter substrate-binding protein [Candidatus Choladocola sp.]|nr:ABC transporter substrate-binding protein [Candidatus Choladocola sp.]
MKKQIFAILSAAVLAAGCTVTITSAEEGQLLELKEVTETKELSPSSAQSSEDDYSFTVGICQLVRHNALDSAASGFQDALTESLGNRVTFDVQNAQGDLATCSAIANGFVSREVDLILANATPALQACITATADIPILGTSVTDYAAALQMDEFDGIVGGNISGTSDLAPLNKQAAMIAELFPGAKQIGLLYCSAEPNSQYQVDVVWEELESMGYTCRMYSFSDSNDLSAVTLDASSNCDVIYVPTDNTIASNAELIANICRPACVPVIAGEESTCRICGVATLSIDYYDLGYQTGKMALRILTENADISKMPVEYATEYTKRYNEEICSEMDITVLEDYEILADD